MIVLKRRRKIKLFYTSLYAGFSDPDIQNCFIQKIIPDGGCVGCPHEGICGFYEEKQDEERNMARGLGTVLGKIFYRREEAEQ